MSSQPNWKRPLILAVTLVVLGGIAYWSEFNHRPKKEDSDEQDKKISQLKDTQVRSIFISDGNHKEITFECLDIAAGLCKTTGGSKWELAEPLKLKGDDSNINATLSVFNNFTASDVISLKDETPQKKAALLKEYGLDPETIANHKDREILISTTTGEIGIYFGTQHPIGEGIFVAVERAPAGQKLAGKINDNTIYILPNNAKATFDRDLNYWRNKKLFSIGSHQVAAFHLKNSKTDLQATKNGTNWTLKVKGDEVAGDPEAIDNLLTGATYLVAKNFAAEKKTEPQAHAVLKGAKLITTLTLELAVEPSKKDKPEEAKAPIVLALYQKQDGQPEKNGAQHMKMYATVSDTDPVYELESYAKDRLEKEPKDLRLGKLITSMDRFSAKKIKFEGASLPQPINLSIKDTKWLDSADAKISIDSDKVQNLLDKLSSTRVKDFIPLNKVGADVQKGESKALKFNLGDDTNAEKHRLEFWKLSGKEGLKLYARDLTSDRKEIFLMDNSLSEALPWDKNTFTKAQTK
jgi:hypothetical protein